MTDLGAAFYTHLRKDKYCLALQTISWLIQLRTVATTAANFRAPKRKVSGWGKGVMKGASIQGWVGYILGYVGNGAEIYSHTHRASQVYSTTWYICFHTSLTQNTTLPPPGFLQVLNYNQPFFKITIIDPLIQPNGGVCCTRLRSQYNINKWPLVDGRTESHS